MNDCDLLVLVNAIDSWPKAIVAVFAILAMLVVAVLILYAFFG